MRELQSSLDYGRVGPSIDPMFGTVSSCYWSSTSYFDGAGVVEISDGSVPGANKLNGFGYVRAVRGAP